MSPFGRPVTLSLTDLQHGINQLFDQVWHAGIRTGPFDGQDWAPPVDVMEKFDRFVIEVELPGLNHNDVEVTCLDNQVTIKGQKTRSQAVDDEDLVKVSERRYGGFCRIITLSEAIKSETLKAKFDKGVLSIEVPKQQTSTRQQIKIEISE